MKTAEEILEKHLLPMIERTKESYASIEEMKAIPEWSVVINAMEEYAEQQVRNCDTPAVINRRELLIDFSMKRNKAPKEFRLQYENEVDEYLKSINSEEECQQVRNHAPDVSGLLPSDEEVINNCPQGSFGTREIWMRGVVWLKERVLKGNER